jgi:hypothetical protein
MRSFIYATAFISGIRPATTTFHVRRHRHKQRAEVKVERQRANARLVVVFVVYSRVRTGLGQVHHLLH